MFIAYDIKNGIEYGKVCTSIREGKKVKKNYTNLGRVLDKERGIFQNRTLGVFTYSVENGYGKSPVDFVPDSNGDRGKMKLILDFGDSFFIDEYLKQTGLDKVVEEIGYGNPDTLKAMLSYYILCNMANCNAIDWFEGNYARIMYPKANLNSQRISDFLTAIGDEYSEREFFKAYLEFLFSKDNTIKETGILIDSTGLPNDIHFPLTAISNHNGQISNEVRLIYVTQQDTGMPIYFRYCPGNVIDTPTLVRTIAELKESGVNTKFAILDAGYYSDGNLQHLYENKISFVTRLKENLKLYKQLVNNHLDGIQDKENFVSYNSRYAYIKRVECELVEGYTGYAYIGLDLDRKSSESHKLFQKAKDQKLSDEDVYEKMKNKGIFILVSSRRIAKDKILPLYYTRQQVEQIFDISKNYADLLPLRVQNEDTFRGHLLLTFIATVFCKMVQDKLKGTKMNPQSLFLNLRNQKCKVYDNAVITQEAFKKANDCYKTFGIECPVRIPKT
ncbi:MAG: transposase [Erysipelotrichaceae bacterium]|nr:transposase [Erysipelotrichaceae bacterium]